MKKLAMLVLSALLVMAVTGCGKKEEATKIPPAGGSTAGMPPGMGMGQGQGQGGEAPAMPPAGQMPPGMGMGQGGETPAMPPGMGAAKPAAPKQIVVPDNVKKMWPAAKIKVINKVTNEEKVIEIAADKSIDIPGTKLKIEVGQYLPDFFMDGQTITSKSDVQINPTVKLKIFEGGKEVYQGWAFEKYPEAHAFNNPDVSVTLVGGVKGK